jgi:hypothetical protein
LSTRALLNGDCKMSLIKFSSPAILDQLNLHSADLWIQIALAK